MVIRPATLADAPAIARVHVASWHTTYPGLMPAEVIAQRTEERSTAQWQRIIAADTEAVFVATDVAGTISGFASCGPCRSEADVALYAGELYAIYLLQAAQGQGVGRALVRKVGEWLTDHGLTSLLVWVLAENPARRFYEVLGGQFVREKRETLGDAMVNEVAYGWRDVAVLR